jgi:hypothetical protein
MGSAKWLILLDATQMCESRSPFGERGRVRRAQRKTSIMPSPNGTVRILPRRQPQRQ